MKSIFKKPSAWLPIVMSLTALAILFVHFVLYGVTLEADEGTAAHLFQILMAGQVPIIAFFLIKWLPQSPKQALIVLAFQVVAALSACAPVYYFNL